MSQLYVVDHAIVRFLDTGDPQQSRRKPGDVVVVCADCLLGELVLPPGHLGVHTLKYEEVDYENICGVCAYCGTVDTRIQLLAERQMKW